MISATVASREPGNISDYSLSLSPQSRAQVQIPVQFSCRRGGGSSATFAKFWAYTLHMYWYWYHLFGPGQKHVSFLGPWTWVMLGSLAQNLFSGFASLLHFKQPWGIRKSLSRRKSRESKREYV